MITKFTTVYAGHVDLPDRGQNATPANERRYSNEHLASVFEKTEAIAKKMVIRLRQSMFLTEHEKEVRRWWTDGGDERLRYTYDLDDTSLVMDLGGYKGQWTSDIYARKYQTSIALCNHQDP